MNNPSLLGVTWAGVGLGVNPWLGMGITGLAGKVRAPIRGGGRDSPDHGLSIVVSG